MLCNYCKKEFKTKITLNNHQKTAKFCLKIQEEEDDIQDDESDNKVICQICNKYFAKNYLLRHMKNLCCSNFYKLNNFFKDVKDEYKINIQELQKENENLKLLIQKQEKQIIELTSITNILKDDHDCLKNIAKQPKNITNNNNKINIISPLNFKNINDLKNVIDNNYKLDYIFSGQKGIAKFAFDHILKDEEGNLKYVCTDPSRQIFKYKDESGEVRKDVEAKKLTNFLVEGGIRDKACDIMNEWWTEETGITNTDKFELLVDKAESLKTIVSDNSEFKKELATMTTI
jgi:hypothetical protein